MDVGVKLKRSVLDEGCKMSPKGLNAAWRAAAKQHYGPWVDVALLNNYVPTAFRTYVECQLFPIPATPKLFFIAGIALGVPDNCRSLIGMAALESAIIHRPKRKGNT